MEPIFDNDDRAIPQRESRALQHKVQTPPLALRPRAGGHRFVEGGMKEVHCGPCVPECQPLSCASEGAECGIIGDGCGGTTDCGPCPEGQVCGAQAPNQCGSGECTPRGCPAGAECGQTGDGCGGVVKSRTCPTGQVCGIETPYICGPAPGCTPVACESVGADCGPIPDGCGGVKDCGDCPPGEVCGANQVNKCSALI